jgi:hypothetical protein
VVLHLSYTFIDFGVLWQRIDLARSQLQHAGFSAFHGLLLLYNSELLLGKGLFLTYLLEDLRRLASTTLRQV